MVQEEVVAAKGGEADLLRPGDQLLQPGLLQEVGVLRLEDEVLHRVPGLHGDGDLQGDDVGVNVLLPRGLSQGHSVVPVFDEVGLPTW